MQAEGAGDAPRFVPQCGVSFGSARRYYLATRTILPFGGLYLAGFTLGREIYFATGHLGLLWGPLGDFRRTSLTSRRHWVPAVTDWVAWLPLAISLAVFGALFLVELRRQWGGGSTATSRLLLVGLLLMAAAASGGQLSRVVPEAILVGLSVLMGICLGAARWPAWTSRSRLAAGAVALGGCAIALIAMRLRDLERLG